MRNTFRLRWAKATDAAAVNELFHHHLRSLGAEPDVALDSDMVDFPAGYAQPGARFCVALDQRGQVIGMGGILAGTLRRLHVAAAWRGRHVAREIVLHLLRAHQFSDPSGLAAIVARVNRPARRVLLSCGFVATGQAPADPRMQHCEILRWEPGLGHPV